MENCKQCDLIDLLEWIAQNKDIKIISSYIDGTNGYYVGGLRQEPENILAMYKNSKQ